MAKNGAGAALGAKTKAGKAKRNGHNNPKRGKMFKALKKQEHRRGSLSGVVSLDKATGAKSATVPTPAAKRRSAISNEFRNFDERMAGQKTKKQQQKAIAAIKNPVIAPPTFIVSAPAFQLNAAPQPAVAPQPDTRGFEGFLSAMQAPRDAPAAPVDHAARKAKPMQPQYNAQNVFAVLNDEEEEERKLQQQQAPAFIQPATFSFAASAPTFTMPTALHAPHAIDNDPDL